MGMKLCNFEKLTGKTLAMIWSILQDSWLHSQFKGFGFTFGFN